MSKVSIILPVYKVSDYIENTMNAIINQDHRPLECIIVNDCTPDDSMEKVAKQLKSYDGDIFFKIINHPVNRGLSAARNSGTEVTSGEYIYYYDSDDEITPNCISTLVATAKKYPDVEMVQGNSATNPPIQERDISKFNFPEYIDNNVWVKTNFLLYDKIPVTAWNKLIKADFIKSNNIVFKEKIIYEDVVWMFDVVKRLCRIAFNLNTTYIYNINLTSISNSSSYRKGFESYAILIKHCYDNTDPFMSNMQRGYILKLLFKRAYDIYRLFPDTDIINKFSKLSIYIFKKALRHFYIKDVLKSLTILLILNLTRSKVIRNIFKVIEKKMRRK